MVWIMMTAAGSTKTCMSLVIKHVTLPKATMRNKTHYMPRGLFLVSLSIILMMVSCGKETKESFDSSLLPGKWNSGTEYYRYDSDGTGVYWDSADDVHEEEAQAFKWSYDDSDNSLTLIHWMEMTQDWTVPRVYTIKQLDQSKLVYEDRFGETYSFDRITVTVPENEE